MSSSLHNLFKIQALRRWSLINSDVAIMDS